MSSCESLDAQLDDVFTLADAMLHPAFHAYVASIPVSEDEPGFIVDWNVATVAVFIAELNTQLRQGANAPDWLRAQNGNVTVRSFVDDVVAALTERAGGRWGRVLFAPNTLSQFGHVWCKLVSLQDDDVLQAVAQTALPVVDGNEPWLARTFSLSDTNVQRAEPNDLNRPKQNRKPLRRLIV